MGQVKLMLPLRSDPTGNPMQQPGVDLACYDSVIHENGSAARSPSFICDGHSDSKFGEGGPPF